MRSPLRFLAPCVLTLACQLRDPLAVAAPETSNAPADLAPAPAPATTLPNIVVVMTDDQREDQLDQMPLTRRLLADSGVRFTKGVHTSPVCCPSRAGFLSGQAQHTHGVLDNYGPQSGAAAFQDASTLATELQSRGYLTALVGKYLNDYVSKGPLYVPPGWDEWRAFKEGGAGSPFVANYYNYTLVERPFGGVTAESTYANTEAVYSTRVLRRKAIDFIGRAPSTQPIFLLLTPYAPHTAVQVLSSTVGSCNSYTLTHSPSVNEADVSDKPAYVQGRPLATATQLANVINTRRKQCEALQTVDRMVSDVASMLRSRGRLANTLFIFTSDNGLLAGEHRLRNRKHSVYLEATTVPLLIRYPGAVMAARDTNLVHMTDLSATIRSVAGIPAPFGAHGQSLLPLLTAPNSTFSNEVLIEHSVLSPANEHFTALRTHTHLYVEYPWGSSSGGPFTELYDLVADPFQMNNIASDPAQAVTVANLAARLAIRRSMP